MARGVSCILTDPYSGKFTEWKQKQGPLILQATTKVNSSTNKTKTYII